MDKRPSAAEQERSTTHGIDYSYSDSWVFRAPCNQGAGEEAFLATLATDDLQRGCATRTGKAKSYHRGQVTNMLRLLGAQPATTDFLEFWDERQTGG
jgi:DinB family